MLYIVNYANQCSLRAVILPISRLIDLRGDDSSVVFDRNERLEIGMYSVVTKLVGVKSFFLDKRMDNRLLEIHLMGIRLSRIFIISSKRTRFGNAYSY